VFHLFHLNSALGRSIQQQLREQIATAILNGNIPLDEALPSSRKLAKQLGIGRNTVVLAYEHLLDDGYLIARERKGYFVNPDILKGSANPPESSAREEDDRNPINWDRHFKIRPSQQHNIVKPQDWQRYKYPFIYGQFDASLFPTVNWRECCRDAVSTTAVSDWAADRFDGDDPLLIEQIRTRLLPRRGVWASADEILVTVGAQQALYLIAKLLLDQGSTIGLEEPGYVDIRNIAKLNPAQLKPIPTDASGLIPDESLQGCDLVYTTPSHQCPTMVTMPLERRYELLKRADEEDFFIIEDDYECETNFDSNPIPALKSLDENNRVIYVGSLSKTLAPGLRLGYLVAPKALIKEARALRRLMVRHPATNNQRSVALFLERGYHDALVMNITRNYKTRWNAMDEALNNHLPESHTAPVFGGSCFWVEGPESLDAEQLSLRAREQSILIEPGHIHFLQQDAPRNCFRLGYSSISTGLIEPGIKKLAELINKG
jgi:GntR family transcriptional regulator/MocR family aminotransferase